MLSVKQNFPNLDFNHKKYYLPIEPIYHTSLLPDSMLRTENEIDFMGQDPEKYALQKVYISFSYKRDMAPGDFVIIYRKGATAYRKGFESVLTTVGVIDEVQADFPSKEAFINYCENRSVFSKAELERFWVTRRGKLLVIKFLFVKSLTKRLNLIHLWENGYIPQNSGPRPFDEMTNDQFNRLLAESGTQIYM